MQSDVEVWSTFSGVGGFDLGLERAGMRVAWQAEGQEAEHHTKEERAYGRWCRAVLDYHWPDVPTYWSVADVGHVAEGAEGARPGGHGTLGAHDASGDARPTWPGLAGGHAGELLDPPRRDRPGRHRDDGQPGRGGEDAEARRGARHQDRGELHAGHGGAAGGRVHVLCGGFPCQDVSVAGKRRGLAGARSGLFFEFARIADALRPEWVLIENVPGLLTSHDGRDFGLVLATLADLGYGLAWRVLDSRYFGVAQRRRRVFLVGRLGDDGSSALRALCESCEGRSAPRVCSWSSPPVRAADGAGGDRAARRYYVEDGRDATLKAGGAGSPPRTDRLPLLVEQGISPALTAHHGRLIGRDEAMIVGALGTPRGSGSGMLSAEAAAGGQLIEGDGRTYSVTPEWGQGADLRAGRIETATALTSASLQAGTERGVRVANAQTVRRLTPSECEALQSFPRGWTLVPGLRCADSRRYGAMGNAVTVNVAEFVGRGIMEEINR